MKFQKLRSGLDRFEARKQLWPELEETNLAVKEAHTLRVPRSQRGGEIIEPLMSKQWFVNMESLAEKALHAVQKGELTVMPERFEKVYIFRTSSVSEKKPNAAALVCKEIDNDQHSQKRQKVNEDNENEIDKVADDEGAQPKARRLTGRKTAVKNQMKKNVSVHDSDNHQQGLVPQEHSKKTESAKHENPIEEEVVLMKDEKDKVRGGEEHQQTKRSG
ncbi:Valine--tRNA ligase, chloroplastic/mitochondrial 2 [Linum perenne]